MKINLFFIIFLFMPANGHVSYKNHKLYEILPTEHQYEDFAAWENIQGIDCFKRRRAGENSTVLVAPEQQNDFENFLSNSDIFHRVICNDYEARIEKERLEMVKTRRRSSALETNGITDFSVYWTFAEIQSYLISLNGRYPTVRLEIIGHTTESRPIYAVKISKNQSFGQKPIIAMEAGMHAREWAAPPTLLYLIHKLVEDPAASAELLEKVDWLIVPMQNPDGFEYSRTVDRMWRSNRKVISRTCVGVDLNRNFAFSWQHPTIKEACGTESYPGPYPLSEEEDYALDNLIKRYKKNVKMYLSIHTYGDLVLYPWGFAEAPGPIKNRDEHIHIGNVWRNAILAATGKSFKIVNSFEEFGTANGAVDDHMYGYYGVDFAFTIELTDGFDFIYPESRIFNLVQETFIGYQALGRYIAQRFG